MSQLNSSKTYEHWHLWYHGSKAPARKVKVVSTAQSLHQTPLCCVGLSK